MATTASSRKRKTHAANLPKAASKRARHKPAFNVHDEEFHIVKASLVLPVSPVFSNDPRAGVEEMLDSMVMRYIRVLRGILISHSNTSFLSKTASILDDCPYLVCKVNFDATVWSPQIGMSLVGKVNLCSPDHIALLLHRTFNVSIPRHHIPVDSWQYEHGPAENDPEYGPHVTDDPNDIEGRGRWRHRVTGGVLGGADGYLKFTVVGMTMANEMLSLHGSLQPDPFSVVHAAGATGDKARDLVHT
ncbi:hypothetical protein APHAL10511_000060 [Amanita phalloides]|nr:hypothetical protein APHAL10511_000060 [Amanita phalloides]